MTDTEFLCEMSGQLEELGQTETLDRVCKRYIGHHIYSVQWQHALSFFDWENHWPAVHASGCLTGAVVETEESCRDRWVHVAQDAVINRAEIDEHGWLVDDENTVYLPAQASRVHMIFDEEILERDGVSISPKAFTLAIRRSARALYGRCKVVVQFGMAQGDPFCDTFDRAGNRNRHLAQRVFDAIDWTDSRLYKQDTAHA